MERKLFKGKKRRIGAFRYRREWNKGARFLPENKGKYFCNACEEEIPVNEDARPSQVPSHCTQCQRLIDDGLMAIANGRLYETLYEGHCCFKEGDGSGDITGADITTVMSLLADDLSLVTVGAIREGNMIRLVIFARI